MTKQEFVKTMQVLTNEVEEYAFNTGIYYDRIIQMFKDVMAGMKDVELERIWLVADLHFVFVNHLSLTACTVTACLEDIRVRLATL